MAIVVPLIMVYRLLWSLSKIVDGRDVRANLMQMLMLVIMARVMGVAEPGSNNSTTTIAYLIYWLQSAATESAIQGRVQGITTKRLCVM